MESHGGEESPRDELKPHPLPHLAGWHPKSLTKTNPGDKSTPTPLEGGETGQQVVQLDLGEGRKLTEVLT